MTSQISMAMLLVASHCFNCWSKGSAGFCGDVEANDRASTDVLANPLSHVRRAATGRPAMTWKATYSKMQPFTFLQLVDRRYRQESAPPDTDRLVKLCEL